MNWTLKHLIGDYEEGNLMSGDVSNLPIQPKKLEGWTIQRALNDTVECSSLVTKQSSMHSLWTSWNYNQKHNITLG